MKMMPATTIPMKVNSKRLVNTLLNIMREGMERVVTDIISARMVPTGTWAK